MMVHITMAVPSSKNSAHIVVGCYYDAYKIIFVWILLAFIKSKCSESCVLVLDEFSTISLDLLPVAGKYSSIIDLIKLRTNNCMSYNHVIYSDDVRLWNYNYYYLHVVIRNMLVDRKYMYHSDFSFIYIYYTVRSL